MSKDKLSELKKLDEELYKEEEKLTRLIESHNKKVRDLRTKAFVLGYNTLDLLSNQL